jgi:hypothetical protein
MPQPSLTLSSCDKSQDWVTVVGYLVTQSVLTVALAAAIPVFVVGLIGELSSFVTISEISSVDRL